MKGLKYYALSIISYALLMSLSGCIEEYEADISSDDSNLLVVEGTIRTGLNTFVLSRTQPLRSDDMSDGMSNYPTYYSYSPQLVRGATVSVRGSDGSEYIAQDYYYSGSYSCRIDRLVSDVGYYLHIEVDGDVYESEPQTPLPTEKITEVRGYQRSSESDIEVLITPAEPIAADQANYYSWTYDETWEVHPDYMTSIYYDVETGDIIEKFDQFPVRGWKDATSSLILVGASTNYDEQHIQDFKLYSISPESERLENRYSGLIHQRAISKAEYEYELARRQAGSEMGGLFTPLPSALPTNLHCLTSNKHVIGFVGCSLNTSEYRFFLNPIDFYIKRRPKPDARLWVDDPSPEDCIRLVNRDYFLCEWINPEMSIDGLLHMAWASRAQLDVRLRGAYIEEPPFWSLNENVSY